MVSRTWESSGKKVEAAIDCYEQHTKYGDTLRGILCSHHLDGEHTLEDNTHIHTYTHTYIYTYIHTLTTSPSSEAMERNSSWKQQTTEENRIQQTSQRRQKEK